MIEHTNEFDEQLQMEEKFRVNAELLVKQVRERLGVFLSYDEPSVAWLDSYINRNRKVLKQEMIDGLIEIFGSYLGECIRHQFGGCWKQINDQWGIEFEEYKKAVFPFNKVSKQLQNGHEDSIASFYTIIPFFLKGGNG